MSRTIKDMPYEVRVCDSYGVKTPRNFRNTDTVRRDPDVWCGWVWEWAIDAGVSDRQLDLWWRTNWLSEAIVGTIAREQNKAYRARCRQKMRNGDYDIPKPVRNARWLAY